MNVPVEAKDCFAADDRFERPFRGLGEEETVTKSFGGGEVDDFEGESVALERVDAEGVAGSGNGRGWCLVETIARDSCIQLF